MFEKPETFEGLDLDALRALSAEALEEARALMAADDADLTDEQIARAEELMTASAELDTEVATREAADAARAEKIAALREAAKDSTPAEDPEEGDEDPEGDDPEEDAEEGDEPAEADSKKEVVVASAPAPKTRRTVAIAQKHAPEVAEPEGNAVATIVAAANVPGYQTGQELADLDAVADAFIARARSFNGRNPGDAKDFKPGVFNMSENAQRFGVARIQKPENEFTTGMDEPVDKQMETVMAAAREQRLPGGSLVAAGGWCAPSETLYDFCSLETTEGLLSIPEVTARRGGINFTKGPDFAALLADADFGFLQTEAQAEAGTVKPCYAVECPPFTEVRLDAIGFCITAGLLTNAAYPELVRRVLELAVVGQARRLNAQTISRISTLIGAAVDYAEIGSSTSDVLDALTIQALRLRYQYSMSPNATLEVILPVWAKEIVRSDLSRRTGVDLLAVTDADITRYFGVRNLAVQWVYDYQNITTANTGAFTAFPTTLEAMIYPAGAFVRLGLPVIDLDTVYDHDNLTTNTYTAAFFEEGFAVANTCGTGVKVSIALNVYGNTGAANIPVAVTP
jgi:hypothetical protein